MTLEEITNIVNAINNADGCDDESLMSICNALNDANLGFNFKFNWGLRRNSFEDYTFHGISVETSSVSED